MSEIRKKNVEPDGWSSLKSFTSARIALGRTGVSMPLEETLRLRLAHAHARDAVYSRLDVELLINAFAAYDIPYCLATSKAESREIYLQRPDLGRVLNEKSKQEISQYVTGPKDIALVVADGLSAIAINENAMKVLLPFIRQMQEAGFSFAPVTVVEQARVAIADEIGSIFQARISVILIGERPGLSAADSLGAYITFDPTPGLTDERRNCISNIREEGLSPFKAVDKLVKLVTQSIKLKLSGVGLKDNDETVHLG